VGDELLMTFPSHVVLPHDPAPGGRVAPVTPWPATLVCARAQTAAASHQARRLAYAQRDFAEAPPEPAPPPPPRPAPDTWPS
jgi:hypothetical protein